MDNGMQYDVLHHPKNVGIHPSGDTIRINNHSGTVIVGGRALGWYESVDVPTGVRVQINGQTGKVVRA
jgi:hypothetical protein